MSSEIKIEFSPIEKALIDLRTSINALDTTLAEEFEEGNELEMVDECNEIKTYYDELFASYEALLIHNIESTDDAVETIQEIERVIGINIRLLGT